MYTLDLVNKEKTIVDYDKQEFPDGQKNIVITGITVSAPEGEYFKHLLSQKSPWQLKNQDVLIQSRLNNFEDLGLIASAAASLRLCKARSVSLYCPYFIGTRSDRKFVDGGNNYLRDVICPILSSLQLNEITVLDPHSNCLEMGLRNLNPVDNHHLVEYALEKIGLDKSLLIAPDAGASHKIYSTANSVGFKRDIVTCLKERDENGNLTKCVVPMGSLWNCDRHAVIIDDICDGGATFNNIAKELRRNGWKNKIYLIVTHGIFSKGFDELYKNFDGIYCTNSYRDFDYLDRLPSYAVHSDKMSGFFNQINVF